MEMQLEHVELLKLARDLHDLPRGMERFQEYLRTMKNGLEDDVDLVPLLVMNPMGREHVAARFDELLALDAESLARDALQETEALFAPLTADFDVLRHGFTILDDVRGGWTNRIPYGCIDPLRHRRRFQTSLDRVALAGQRDADGAGYPPARKVRGSPHRPYTAAWRPENAGRNHGAGRLGGGICRRGAVIR
ncbi:MAG: hypothetical protein CUN53_06040 [Phototrophicales bacterium]|nr:MAG: hypothetical protein CUN53_06040 [Phototrophicales bacterium]